MNAEVVLRITEQADIIPDLLSIGGFEAKSATGRRYMFDWDSAESTIIRASEADGYVIVKWKLSNLNTEDYGDFNIAYGVDEPQLTPEFIISSELKNVYYECQLNGIDMGMELERFKIYGDNGRTYAFSREEIENYNKISLQRIA